MTKKTKNTKNFRNTNYPVGDFLIQIKNACMARKKTVSVRKSKFIESVAKALVKEGYLNNVTKSDEAITVAIAYHKKEPILMGLQLVSSPGLRRYMSVDDLVKYKGPEKFLISTPDGVMFSKDAIKKRVGGEAIVKIL